MLLPLLLPPLLAVQRTAQMSQERERLAQDREHQALHDQLTGLPNQTLLANRIEAGLARPRRRGERLVVLLLDLDSFKTVNDGLGHGIGDSLLIDVAERLTQVVRPGDTLSRFSGDEFAIVCEAIRDRELESLVETIRRTIAAPFTIATHEVTLTASIGVAPATPGASAQSLIREADSAMFRAKSAGRDQAAHFHQTMHDQATARLDDQLGLRRALERDELRAHYQPVVDLTTGEAVGMEALVRWQHPERGLIAPDQFIPLAEDTGLILPLGAWMLETALGQLQQWRREMPEAHDLWMAVNLSPRQLTDPDLIHKVSRALAETGVPPGNLHLEITETAVMSSVDASTSTLDALRQLGVHLIIDDFGTGYSSLARLKKLPVTALKVDRSFVDGLGRDSSDLSIVDAIINMADSLALGRDRRGRGDRRAARDPAVPRRQDGPGLPVVAGAAGRRTGVVAASRAPARGARRGPRPLERPPALTRPRRTHAPRGAGTTCVIGALIHSRSCFGALTWRMVPRAGYAGCARADVWLDAAISNSHWHKPPVRPIRLTF